MQFMKRVNAPESFRPNNNRCWIASARPLSGRVPGCQHAGMSSGLTALSSLASQSESLR